MVAQNQNQKTVSTEWFDSMVANIRYDQVLHNNDLLEEEKKKLYDAIMNGDDTFLHNYARQTSSAHFIKYMVEAYFNELVNVKSKPKRMALELSNSKILVWAEINDDDDLMEDALILAEAKINAYFSKYGFYISSTIVENSDCLIVPDHYKNVTIS